MAASQADAKPWLDEDVEEAEWTRFGGISRRILWTGIGFDGGWIMHF